jgi:hypothetical protein
MIRYVFALVCASLSGCMVQDAHDAQVEAQCEATCDTLRECRSGDEYFPPECGLRAACRARCATNPMHEQRWIDWGSSRWSKPDPRKYGPRPQ